MALIWGGRVLVVAGMLIGAVPGLAHAQAAAPDTQDPYYHFLMARHLESEGDTAGALAALQRAAAADPRAAEIHAEMALLQYRRNERGEAEKAAKTALSIDSANLEANRVMGFLQVAAFQNERATPAERSTRLRDAIMYLERAAAAQPTPDLSLITTLGRLYLTNGEGEKAIGALTRALAQNPFSFDIRQTLALAFAAENDYARAIAALAVLADEDPRALALVGEYQFRAGQHEQATDTFTRVLATQPNNPELKQKRIRAAYLAQRYDAAASYAADARREHPDVPQFARLQAQALSKSGRDSDAEQVLRQILRSNPSEPDVLNELGYLLAVQGRDLDEAISLVTRALQVRPDSGAYLDSLGWAHFKRGDLDQAEKYLRDAAQRLPDNSEILDHLGDLHAARGRWTDAIAAWRRAIDANNSDIDRAALEKKIVDAQSRVGR